MVLGSLGFFVCFFSLFRVDYYFLISVISSSPINTFEDSDFLYLSNHILLKLCGRVSCLASIRNNYSNHYLLLGCGLGIRIYVIYTSQHEPEKRLQVGFQNKCLPSEMYIRILPPPQFSLLPRSMSYKEEKRKRYVPIFSSRQLCYATALVSYLKPVRCCVTCHICLVIILCIVARFLLKASLWLLFAHVRCHCSFVKYCQLSRSQGPPPGSLQM